MSPPTSGRDSSATVAGALLACVDELTDELVSRILTGDHAYSESTLLTQEQLHRAVHENLSSILAQLAGTAPTNMTAARSAGRLKAEQGVPLAALLHAYRLCGRLVWERLLAATHDRQIEALPRLGSEVWSIIDEYSSAAAEAHGQYTADRARRDERDRRMLLEAILAGTAGARLWESLRTLQLPEVGRFLVVSAEVTDGDREPLPGVSERLARANVQSVWAAGLDAHTGLLNLPGACEEEDVCDALALVGTGRIGVSGLFTSPQAAPAAVREAQIACRSVPRDVVTVTRHGSSPLGLLLAEHPDASNRFAEQVLGEVLRLPTSECDTLLHTLAVWFDCEGSASEAADRLHYHRNTIHQRLRHIEELTGRSCSRPGECADLYAALRAVQLSGTRPVGRG